MNSRFVRKTGAALAAAGAIAIAAICWTSDDARSTLAQSADSAGVATATLAPTTLLFTVNNLGYTDTCG